MSKTWNLILSPPLSGAENMALDEKLFNDYRPGVSRPVVRLYRWAPAAFSVGRSQDPAALLKTDNVVRRPTGGGCLYHDDELTYAVVLSPSDLETTGSVKETFRHMAGFLIRAYRKLGLEAAFADDRPDRTPDAAGIETVCLSRREDLDIVVNGKKIGGNAQKRGRDRILQHGSIPLSLDTAAYRAALRDPRLLDVSKVTTLSEALGRRVGYDELQQVLTEAVAEHFNATLARDETHGTPTPLAQKTSRA